MIYLLWKFLLNEMVSLFTEDDLQVRHEMLHLSGLYVIFHPWELESIILLTHDQQRWTVDFGISNDAFFSKGPVYAVAKQTVYYNNMTPRRDWLKFGIYQVTCRASPMQYGNLIFHIKKHKRKDLPR